MPSAPPMFAIPGNGLFGCFFSECVFGCFFLLLFFDETTSTSASMACVFFFDIVLSVNGFGGDLDLDNSFFSGGVYDGEFFSVEGCVCSEDESAVMASF